MMPLKIITHQIFYPFCLDLADLLQEILGGSVLQFPVFAAVFNSGLIALAGVRMLL